MYNLQFTVVNPIPSTLYCMHACVSACGYMCVCVCNSKYAYAYLFPEMEPPRPDWVPSENIRFPDQSISDENVLCCLILSYFVLNLDLDIQSLSSD